MSAPIPDALPHRRGECALGVRSSSQAIKWHLLIGEGQTVREVANMLKVHRSTLYRAIAPADTTSDMSG